MVGLYQSTTAPSLSSSLTIQSLATSFIGVIQELNENVWSFFTSGPGTSPGYIKTATTISSATTNESWFELDIINTPTSNIVSMTLIDQLAGTSASVSYTYGGSNTTTLTELNYIIIQRTQAESSGDIANSGQMQMSNVRLWA